jgi:hypothetical protein
LWHEKVLIADRLLSDLAPQWVGDDGDVYLPLPTHAAMPMATPADHSELPPAVCYLKARPDPERLDDGSPCQQCGTVDEDKPRQWVHNQLTGHQYLSRPVKPVSQTLTSPAYLNNS